MAGVALLIDKHIIGLSAKKIQENIFIIIETLSKNIFVIFKASKLFNFKNNKYCKLMVSEQPNEKLGNEASTKRLQYFNSVQVRFLPSALNYNQCKVQIGHV